MRLSLAVRVPLLCRGSAEHGTEGERGELAVAVAVAVAGVRVECRVGARALLFWRHKEVNSAERRALSMALSRGARSHALTVIVRATNILTTINFTASDHG